MKKVVTTITFYPEMRLIGFGRIDDSVIAHKHYRKPLTNSSYFRLDEMLYKFRWRITIDTKDMAYFRFDRVLDT